MKHVIYAFLRFSDARRGVSDGMCQQLHAGTYISQICLYAPNVHASFEMERFFELTIFEYNISADISEETQQKLMYKKVGS